MLLLVVVVVGGGSLTGLLLLFLLFPLFLLLDWRLWTVRRGMRGGRGSAWLRFFVCWWGRLLLFVFVVVEYDLGGVLCSSVCCTSMVPSSSSSSFCLSVLQDCNAGLSVVGEKGLAV